MVIRSKYLKYCAVGLFILSNQNVFAWQPVADLQLASMIGEQSPLKLEPQNFELLSSAINELNEAKDNVQPLSIMEQHVQDSLLKSLNQPLLNAIDNKHITLHQKNEFIIKTLHTSAENNFGLEPFSMTWYGNYQDIVDIEQTNYITFNSRTGQYEFDNVRGQVTISAYVNNNQNKPILLTRAPMPLQ